MLQADWACFRKSDTDRTGQDPNHRKASICQVHNKEVCSNCLWKETDTPSNHPALLANASMQKAQDVYQTIQDYNQK